MLDPNSESSDSGSLDRSTVHHLLSSERRRHVLSCLADHESMALSDLADEVAEREHDTPLQQVPEDAVLTTYLSLYHTHVPKLAQADVVTYDQDCDTAALAEDTDSLEAVGPLDRAVSAD